MALLQCHYQAKGGETLKKYLVLITIFTLLANPLWALGGTYGARPMGMGGAFTAVSDDANAIYWYPAGLALNPEVTIVGSTKLTNRNSQIGDNLLNMKFCYETEMNPFDWLVGVGVASALALQSAQYLHDQGVVQKGWGREGETTGREQSMAGQVSGTMEVESLRQLAKSALKTIGGGAKEAAHDVAHNTTVVIAPNYWWGYDPGYRPHYWNQPVRRTTTKAQFALGLSWLSDYNPPLDQNSNWYTIGIASGFEQRIAVGANLNLYHLKKISTDIQGAGGDLDLGVIARPVEYITVGLTTKGVLTTDIHWQDGSKTRYDMLVNGGLAIKPVPRLTVAADVHNIFQQGNSAQTLHYGAEAVILPGLLVRGGLSEGNKTAGASLALGNAILDYAILGGQYSRTQMAGFSWTF